MLKQGIAFRFALALAAVLTFGQAQAANRIPGEYLVKYKDSEVVATASIRSIAGLRIASHNPFGRLFKVKVNMTDEVGTLARILRDPNVQYVVPNIKVNVFTQSISSDTSAVKLKDQWSLKKVRAQEAWTRAGNRGSKKVIVAVIDTGADSKHESLAPNMVAGYNFKDNNDDPFDKTVPGGANPGHGTHCSGIIGGTGVVEGGISGISPDVAIMPLRFLDENGSGDLNAGIKAIDYAIQKHVQVISASWGAAVSRQQAQPLIEAVKRADDAGIPFIVAASNDGKNNDSYEVYPANSGHPNMISVAASGPNDEKPSWSNYGKRSVHLASPGLDIMSTLPGGKYGNLSGTSMATPLVAGLVGFLKAQEPSLTGAQARALLQLTGAKANIETACNCRVDAFAAVDALLNHTMFITPAAASLAVGEKIQFSATFGQAPLKFAVADSSVGSINANGEFTAAKDGNTTVTVTDASGKTSTSLNVIVGGKSSGGGGGNPPGGGLPFPPGEDPGDGGGGGGGGNCPLGDQQTCDIICQIMPDQPFCKK